MIRGLPVKARAARMHMLVPSLPELVKRSSSIESTRSQIVRASST
jgi:hypothetical protein